MVKNGVRNSGPNPFAPARLACRGRGARRYFYPNEFWLQCYSGRGADITQPLAKAVCGHIGSQPRCGRQSALTFSADGRYFGFRDSPANRTSLVCSPGVAIRRIYQRTRVSPLSPVKREAEPAENTTGVCASRTDSNRTLLTFQDVALKYERGPEIFSDLSFTIAPQSFQFLTGPSGAGKTTLLRMMMLSMRPSRGTIHIFGEDASKLSKDAITTLRRRIGVVFQDFRLLEHLTTYQNVALPLLVMGQSESALPRGSH